jgi:hypothetical protein
MADTSMYRMIQPVDAMGAIEGGMKMRDLIDERKKKSAIQGAYKQGMQVGPDGKVNFDHNMTASALAEGGYGQEAYAAQQQGQGDQQKQMEVAVKNAQYGAQVLGAARNQDEWNQGLQQLQNNGMDASKLPGQFSPENQRFLVDSAMSLGDRLNEQFRNKQLEASHLDRKEARDERRFQAGIKMDEKMQGLKTPYGTANTEDDAKQLKSAFETKTDFDTKLQAMIDLREKHKGGAILNREDVQRGKQLSKDVLLAYKDMSKLGVLSKSDEAILNAIIPEDPLEYNSPLSAVQGQDPILHRLKSFKQDSSKDFETKVSTRTRAGIDGAAASAGPKASPDVMKYAATHGISVEQAQMIKDQRTMPKAASR